MTNVNWNRRSCRTATAVLVAAALSAVPVRAQQAAPPPTPQGPALRLSMNEAVAMALETNLGLKADRLSLDAAAQSIAGARAAYLPQFVSRVGRSTAKSVPSDFTQGFEDITSASVSGSGTISQALRWFGSDYSVSWSGNRRTLVGGFSSFNPSLNSSLTLSFTQPLLRDLRIDAPRAGLETAERSRTITDLQVQQSVFATEVQVKHAYLSLIAALEGKKVAQQNMDIAEQSLRHARARVAVGQAPQIEIIQAQAQVASNRESVIAAEASIAQAEDFLRQLVLDPARPDYWQVRLEPTDSIQLTPFQVDVDGAIANALATRLDLTVARQQLDITDLNLRLNRNLTLPSVDFSLTYAAQGTAGTQFQFGSGFPPTIVGRTDRSFGSALGDTFAGAYPSWSLGVQVGYPIGRTSAEAAFAQAQIRKRQQEIGLRDLELEIVRQVRDAARQVSNSYERVQAARAAREASVLELEAEDRRFEVGLSTPLDQQFRQSRLAQARVVELNAMILYNRAIINFERVQKIQ